MRKRKEIPILENITIQNIASEGKCVARYEEKVIFVAGNLVAPEDVVDLKIIQRKKNYWEAIPVHFHQKASYRLQPFCTHFGTCGGCKWQHIPYERQLAHKQQQVIDNLQRIAKIQLPDIQPILGSVNTQFYRNKLEFTFSNKRWWEEKDIALQAQDLALPSTALGFHVPGRFDKVLDIEKCYLQDDFSNQIRISLKEFAQREGLTFFDLKEQKGFLRNLVIRNTSLGEWMVMVIFAENHPTQIEQVMGFLKQQFPQITSLQYILNTKRNDTYSDLPTTVFAGKDHIIEQMEDLKFRISPQSFFQTNTLQALRLYQIARTYADLQGNEVVYDLYTGTGTIANFVARKAKKVIGLEYVPEAIEDAKRNATLNHITNVDFFAGDLKDLLNEDFWKKHSKPDVIITDPPRAGMHENVIQAILQIAPQKIVYVSCNPATQARDLVLLDEKYSVEAVQPVDMFPHTHHVENVVKLVKRVGI